ncbi:MAG: hypothetical protein ACTSWR_08240 [Candidatus Helarchaeota archaeon]
MTYSELSKIAYVYKKSNYRLVDSLNLNLVLNISAYNDYINMMRSEPLIRNNVIIEGYCLNDVLSIWLGYNGFKNIKSLKRNLFDIELLILPMLLIKFKYKNIKEIIKNSEDKIKLPNEIVDAIKELHEDLPITTENDSSKSYSVSYVKFTNLNKSLNYNAMFMKYNFIPFTYNNINYLLHNSYFKTNLAQRLNLNYKDITQLTTIFKKYAYCITMIHLCDLTILGDKIRKNFIENECLRR